MSVRAFLASLGFAYARDDHGRWRKGDWCQSYSGARVWPLDPRADEVHYDDVCIGLARECRYGNQCREFYSVAEHSVLVSIYAEKFAERHWELGVDPLLAAREGLLHDAPEAYLGDIPRPFKHKRVMRGYRSLETKWDRAIMERFGVQPTQASSAIVKSMDKRILIDEIDQLMFDPDMWQRPVRYPGVIGLGADIAAMEWPQAAAAFSQRFAELFPDFLDDES